MRRVLLGMAAVAVLGVAPLAAAAPASAAVQHPSAAQTDNCTDPAWIYNTSSNSATGSLVGYWNVNTSSSNEASGSSGEVEDSYSHKTEFCLSTTASGYLVFRQKDTNDCATWDQKAAPDNTVQMFTCSPSNTDAQDWENPGSDGLTTFLNVGDSILGGTGGDTAVYMAGNPPNPWWFDCSSTSCS
jgi:hypothetical protein